MNKIEKVGKLVVESLQTGGKLSAAEKNKIEDAAGGPKQALGVLATIMTSTDLLTKPAMLRKRKEVTSFMGELEGKVYLRAKPDELRALLTGGLKSNSRLSAAEKQTFIDRAGGALAAAKFLMKELNQSQLFLEGPMAKYRKDVVDFLTEVSNRIYTSR